MKSQIKTALVVEGGAMRGVFTTGLLDAFLDRQFNPFDGYLGVSSGAGNLAAYLAEMAGRNLKICTDYSQRSEFISIMRFLKGGHLLDLDWLWRITISEMRLDLPAIYSKNKPFIVCMTNVNTGKPVYKHTSAETLEHVLKASSALPLIYRDFPVVDGYPMADGGLSDAIPVEEAIRSGANRIMVIRSRPKNYIKKENILQHIMLRKLRHKPELQAAVLKRVRKYNDTLSFIRTPPAGVSIIEACPPVNFRLSRFTRNQTKILEGYDLGYKQADKVIRLWKNYEN